MNSWRVACVALLGAVCVLGGCATNVVLVNPRTGETTVCYESFRGLDPWSQQEACIGRHIASGWVRADGAQP